MLSNEEYLHIFHEIKNSITLINSSLQLVAKKHPEVNNFEYWNETMTEITFLKNMVTELSSVRASSHLHIASVNIDTFMQQISTSIRALSWENFRCELILPETLPPVEMDASLLKQAVINLVKNAYEAMHKSGTISIEVTADTQQISIAVTDHGGGLNPELADTIFEPFATSKTGGSGLGLVITRQIAAIHHGSLTCDSRPGDGCTFTISLPLKQN